MNIVVNRSEFAKALSVAATPVGDKSPQPILQHVRLDAPKGGPLTIVGTDLAVTMRAAASCAVKTPGAACLNARNLIDRVKLLGGADVALKVEGDSVLLQSGDRRFKLSSLSAEDFPRIETRTAQGAVIPAETIASLLARGANSMGEPNQSSAIASFWTRDGRTEVTSMNGRRMSWATAKIDLTKDQRALGLRTTDLLRRFVDGATGDLRAEFKGETFIATLEGGATFIATCASPAALAAYPQVMQQIALSKGPRIEVERKAFLDSVRAVSAPSEFSHVTLKAEGGKLRLLGIDGVSEDSIPCVGGEGLLTVSGQHLTACAGAAETERIELELGTSLMEPLTIREVEGLNEARWFVMQVDLARKGMAA
jgi:DNA polymerase III sliding clamp (beta) subunit (PCNA family)